MTFQITFTNITITKNRFSLALTSIQQYIDAFLNSRKTIYILMTFYEKTSFKDGDTW